MRAEGDVILQGVSKQGPVLKAERFCKGRVVGTGLLTRESVLVMQTRSRLWRLLSADRRKFATFCGGEELSALPGREASKSNMERNSASF